MAYINDFLRDEDDEEDKLFGDAYASPQASSLSDYSQQDDDMFQSFIGQTADEGALQDFAPMPDSEPGLGADALRAKTYEADQSAISDMRNSLNSNRGLNGDDAVFAAIAAALDLGLNKGRGMGQLAMGMGQGLMARQQHADKQIDQLGNLSLKQGEAERGRLREQGMQDYYTHQRQLGDQRMDLELDREARLSLGDPEQDEVQRAQAEKMRAETQFLNNNNGLDPSQVALQNERNYQHGRDASADAAAAAKVKAKEDKILEMMGAVPEGYEVGDEKAWRRVNEDEVLARKVLAAAKGGVSALGSADTMQKVRGGGAMIPFRDDERIGQYDLARRATFGGLTPFTELGTLQKHDIDLLNPIYPESLNLKDLAQAVGKDPNSDRIRGANKELRGLVDRGVGTYGLRLKPPPDQQPPATAGRMGKDPALEGGGGGLEIDPFAQEAMGVQDDGAYASGVEEFLNGPQQPSAAPSFQLGGQRGAPSGGVTGAIGKRNGDGTVTVKFPDGRTGNYREDDPRLISKGVVIQ